MMPVTIHQEQAGAPIRNTPIRIIVDENAKAGTGGYHPVELDGLAILITAVLTVAFTALTCWLWWSRVTSSDPTSAGAHRVGRKMGLSRAERSAVLNTASAAQVEPAAMLLSTSVFDRFAPKASKEDAQTLIAAREKLASVLADGPPARAQT